MNPEWDRDQFLAYVLLYAAYADLELSENEEEFIQEQVGKVEYEEVKAEFLADTDKDRAYKIINFSQGEDFDHEYAQMVKNEMHDLFLADGEYTHWEKAIGRALTRLMNI